MLVGRLISETFNNFYSYDAIITFQANPK